MDSLFYQIRKDIKTIAGDMALNSASPPAGGYEFVKDKWLAIQSNCAADFDYIENKNLIDGLDINIQKWTQSIDFKSQWHSLPALEQSRIWFFSQESYLNVRRCMALEELLYPSEDLIFSSNIDQVGQLAKEVFNLPINIGIAQSNDMPLVVKILRNKVLPYFPSLNKTEFELEGFNSILILAFFKKFGNNSIIRELANINNVKFPLSMALEIQDYCHTNKLDLVAYKFNTYCFWIKSQEEKIKDILFVEKEKISIDSALSSSLEPSKPALKV